VKCTHVRPDGTQCRANAPSGARVCHFHDPDPAKRAAHRAQSLAGGLAKAAARRVVGAPLADDPTVAALDLTTLPGLRELQAANLRALAKSAFDVKLANSLTNALTAQRSIVETSDLAERVAVLEAALEAAVDEY